MRYPTRLVNSPPRFAALRLPAFLLLLTSLLSLAPAPGHAAAVAAASRPTPRNFTYTLTPQGRLTIAFDLANTGTAPSANTQITSLSLVSLTNAPLGTRLTPAALPSAVADIAAGASRHLSVTYANIAAGTRARFSLALSAAGPVYASTGFVLTVPESPVPTAAPTNLTGTRLSGGVALTYTAPAGAVTSYNIKRATVSGGPYTTISTAGAVTGTSYTDTTASIGTTYYYVVSAVSAGGESANSNQAVVAAVLNGTGLVATPGNGSVKLTYDATPGATRYLPYVSTDGTNFSALTFTTATAYTQSGLTNGKTYYYYVVPYNGTTAGTASGTVSALVSLPAPTNLTATPGATSITLTFTASAGVGANNYEVFESTNPNAPAANYVSLGDTNGDTTFTQTGLTPGTTYYYVVPQNAGGPGTPSVTVHATVPVPVSLSAPTSLTGTHGSGIIRLAWVAPTGAVAYYNVKRSTTSGGPYTTISTANTVKGTTYDDTSVVNGTTYYYIVTAIATNSTESVPSNQAAVLAGFIGTGLTAAPGNGLVTLTYDPIIGATNYQVFYSADNGSNFYGLGYTGNVTTFTQTGLTNDHTYLYYVVPYNDAGAGAASATVSATVSLPAPTGITATPGNGSERIDWTASTFPGATNYQVFYSSDNGSNFYGLGFTGNVTTFTQTGLTNGQTYKYYVVPYNDGGAGTPSVTISSTVSLPAPTNITLMPGNGLMKISWTASGFPGASNYQVFYSSDNGANFYGLGFTGNVTTFTQTGLTNGTIYKYYVVAYNDGGSSPNSLTATATVSLPAPTNVTATPGNGSVTVKWTASAYPGATNYQVFYSSDNGANFYGLGYTGNVTTFTQTGLTNNKSYSYYVVAYNDGGSSPNSATISAVTVTLPPPGNVVATPGNGLVTVTWNAVPTASNYQVFYSSDNGANFYGLGYTGTATTYTQTGLTNGTTYKYYVVAYNDGGPSVGSTVVSAIVTLAAPTGITAAPGNGSVTVKWTASAYPGATDYQVFYSSDNGANFYGLGYTGNVTTFTQTGLTDGTTYKYYVVPYNDGGAGTASATVSATPTGLAAGAIQRK